MFEGASSSWLKRSSTVNKLRERRWDVELRRREKSAVPIIKHNAKISLANSHRVRQHGLEHRLKIAG